VRPIRAALDQCQRSPVPAPALVPLCPWRSSTCFPRPAQAAERTPERGFSRRLRLQKTSTPSVLDRMTLMERIFDVRVPEKWKTEFAKVARTGPDPSMLTVALNRLLLRPCLLIVVSTPAESIDHAPSSSSGERTHKSKRPPARPAVGSSDLIWCRVFADPTRPGRITSTRPGLPHRASPAQPVQ